MHLVPKAEDVVRRLPRENVIVALAVDMRDSYDDLTMMNLILGGEGKFVKIVAHRRITDQVIIQPEEARKMFQFLKTAWHQKQAKTQPHG